MNISLPEYLDQLRQSLFAMGALVESRANKVIDSILRNDFPSAKEVRHGDREVDEMDVSIEKMCIEILALHSPVAHDLRLVLAALRIDSELERIGDLAKGIAKRLLALDRRGHQTSPEALQSMAVSVRDMLADTLNALSEENCDEARRIRASDNAVDEMYKGIVNWTQEEIARSGGVDSMAIIDYMRIGRGLERIGDMCTNIAEEIIFIVEGRVVRHREA